MSVTDNHENDLMIANHVRISVFDGKNELTGFTVDGNKTTNEITNNFISEINKTPLLPFGDMLAFLVPSHDGRRMFIARRDSEGRFNLLSV